MWGSRRSGTPWGVRHSRLANLPARVTAGALLVSSGLSKLQGDKEGVGSVHAMASGTHPMLDEVPPESFAKGLGVAECALGGALLFPPIGDGLAGLSLSAFSSGLLALYWKTPGLRQEGGIRPNQEGMAIARDVWPLGIGLSLMAHSMGARRQARRIERAKRSSHGSSKAA